MVVEDNLEIKNNIIKNMQLASNKYIAYVRNAKQFLDWVHGEYIQD